MKRVAWLVIGVAGLMVGCDRTPPKDLTVSEIDVAAPRTPNVAVDSASGVSIPALDLSVMKSQPEMKLDYDHYTMALRDASKGNASKKPPAAVPAAGNGTGGDASIPTPPSGDSSTSAPASAPAAGGGDVAPPTGPL